MAFGASTAHQNKEKVNAPVRRDLLAKLSGIMEKNQVATHVLPQRRSTKCHHMCTKLTEVECR